MKKRIGARPWRLILNFLNPYKKGARMIFYTNIHLKKPYEEQAIIQKIKNNKIYLNIYKKDFIEVIRKEIISRNPKYNLWHRLRLINDEI